MGKPQVFIYVEGGITYWLREGDVDVEVFDGDSEYDVDDENFSKIPRDFADMARAFGIEDKYIEE